MGHTAWRSAHMDCCWHTACHEFLLSSHSCCLYKLYKSWTALKEMTVLLSVTPMLNQKNWKSSYLDFYGCSFTSPTSNASLNVSLCHKHRFYLKIERAPPDICFHRYSILTGWSSVHTHSIGFQLSGSVVQLVFCLSPTGRWHCGNISSAIWLIHSETKSVNRRHCMATCSVCWDRYYYQYTAQEPDPNWYGGFSSICF